MNKMSKKKAWVILGATALAAAAFTVGESHGAGFVSGIISKKCSDVTEEEMVKIVDKKAKDLFQKLYNYVYIEGLKQGYRYK